MPPGRPKKYHTEEERKAASRASNQASYQRTSYAVSRRRKFKRAQRRALQFAILDDADVTDSLRVQGTLGVQPAEEGDQVPTTNRLLAFVEANQDSPAEPLLGFLLNEIDAAPSPRDPVAACSHWQKSVRLFKGKQWGAFAYDHLAIPDGDLLEIRMKDFERVLFAVDNLAAIASEIVAASSEVDPSGAGGPFLEAKWLSRDVGLASLHLEEIVSLRRNGLDTLQTFAAQRSLEFQNIIQ